LLNHIVKQRGGGDAVFGMSLSQTQVLVMTTLNSIAAHVLFSSAGSVHNKQQKYNSK